MDNILNITTIIANIVTIIGLSSGFIYLLKLIRRKSNPKIIIDQDFNLLTNKKKIQKIIMRIIKSQDTVDNINIITRNIKKYKGNSIGLNILNKRYELRNITNELCVKRGIKIIVSQAIIGIFETYFINNLDDLIIDYINEIKNYMKLNENINKQREKYSLGIDVFVKIDKNTEIKTIIYLTKSEEEKLKEITGGHLLIPYLDIKDIEETNKSLIKTAMLGLILRCALYDEMWDGNEFIFKDNLPLILNKFEWQVGLH